MRERGRDKKIRKEEAMKKQRKETKGKGKTEKNEKREIQNKRN